ncbi:hypothetical protein SMD44_05101 [Streptomyces alboflavus]|uniref:Uncharacterized protein n=1 Tax=Streptomyces alboflavus TaxID=67267 RepID=A0A1Z1WGQ8_9ACTN|nr:hypothetical protein SMD44_05101 [Streptomyces alboflavus]
MTRRLLEEEIREVLDEVQGGCMDAVQTLGFAPPNYRQQVDSGMEDAETGLLFQAPMDVAVTREGLEGCARGFEDAAGTLQILVGCLRSLAQGKDLTAKNGFEIRRVEPTQSDGQ